MNIYIYHIINTLFLYLLYYIFSSAILCNKMPSKNPVSLFFLLLFPLSYIIVSFLVSIHCSEIFWLVQAQTATAIRRLNNRPLFPPFDRNSGLATLGWIMEGAYSDQFTLITTMYRCFT